jgi:hypothetical protein
MAGALYANHASAFRVGATAYHLTALHSVKEETAMSAATSRLIDDYLAGPEAVRRAVAGMTREQVLARPIPGKWSTLEVVCHLLDSEQAYVHRMKRVIAEDRPLLIGYDESRFAARLFYHDRDLATLLDLIEGNRREMAHILRHLPEEAWKREAVHNERGLETLESIVRLEVEHIAHHLRHVSEKRKELGLSGLS